MVMGQWLAWRPCFERHPRTAGSTATGAHNHSHARPSTTLATCRARPDLAHACGLHPEGLAYGPEPSVHRACTKHRPAAGSRGLERSPRDSNETTSAMAFPQLEDKIR